MKERLKVLRKNLDLNQTTFADKIGVTQATIAIWERGGTIPESRIQAICQTFKVHREWLVDGQGEMFDRSEELTREDAFVIVAMELYSQLNPKGKELALKCAKKLLAKKEEENVSKSQINNGTVGGDMIQG